MCANTKAKRSFASQICRARRNRPRSICAASKAAFRRKCSVAASFPRISERPYTITLPPYGFFWFLLCQDETEPAREVRTDPGEFETLVMPDGWVGVALRPDALDLRA